MNTAIYVMAALVAVLLVVNAYDSWRWRRERRHNAVHHEVFESYRLQREREGMQPVDAFMTAIDDAQRHADDKLGYRNPNRRNAKRSLARDTAV